MGRKRTNFGEINIPTKWEDISLEKYIKIVNLYDETENKPSLQQIIAVLSDKDVDEINQYPAEILDKIMENLSFLKDEISQEMNNQIVIDDETYIINYMEKLKLGEFVDVQRVTQEDKNNYAMVLAILCRKEGEKYDDDFIADILSNRIEMFNKQPITKIYPTISFFLTLHLLSPENMNIYSQKILDQINLYVTAIENSQKDGIGQKHFSNSQMKKLKKLKKSARHILQVHLNSSHICSKKPKQKKLKMLLKNLLGHRKDEEDK